MIQPYRVETPLAPYRNESQILKIARVVGRRRRIAAATIILSLGALIFATHFIPRQYSASASLLLTGQRPELNDQLTTVLTTLAKSSAILDHVEAAVGPSVSLDQLRKNIKVRLSGTIISTTFTGPDPASAVEVPNAVDDALVTYYEKLASAQYDSETQRLQREIQAKQQQLRDLDRQFQQMVAQGVPSEAVNDSASSDEESTLSALRLERLQAESAVSSDTALIQPPVVRPDPSGQVSDGPYQTLVSQLERDEATLVSQRVAHTDDFPGMKALEAQVEDERRSVEEARKRLAASQASQQSLAQQAIDRANQRASAVVAADRAKVDEVQQQIDDVEARSSKIADSRPAIQTLKAERDGVQAQFTALSASLASVLASRANSDAYGTLTVIDRATSADVAGISRVIIIMLAVLVAVAVTIAVCFTAEYTDRRFYDENDVRAFYGTSVIALIK